MILCFSVSDSAGKCLDYFTLQSRMLGKITVISSSSVKAPASCSSTPSSRPAIRACSEEGPRRLLISSGRDLRSVSKICGSMSLWFLRIETTSIFSTFAHLRDVLAFTPYYTATLHTFIDFCFIGTIYYYFYYYDLFVLYW